jgi:hypothetical protein
LLVVLASNTNLVSSNFAGVNFFQPRHYLTFSAIPKQQLSTKVITMGHDYTPPNSRPNTPDPETPKSARQHSNVEASIATPTSIASTSPALAPEISAFSVPKHLTQGFVEIDPQLKRFQQDLLVLTGLNDNSTLHWRPTWFTQESLSKNFWTIHNSPNVVTEKLLSTVPQGREYYTRRMRRDDDAPPPPYIKDWDHWRHYCDMYGIPHDFLCEEQVSFMRMGLPRNENGVLCRKSPTLLRLPDVTDINKHRQHTPSTLSPSLYAKVATFSTPRPTALTSLESSIPSTTTRTFKRISRPSSCIRAAR